MSKNQVAKIGSIVLSLIASLFAITPSGIYAQKTPQNLSLMWKATNGKNTTYLLGSVHLGTKDFYPLPREIEAAFEQSSVLLVEFDLNKIDPATAQSLILKNGVYTGDDNLWKHLGGSTAAQVKKFCAEHNLPVEAFARLKPWVVAITVGVIDLQKQGMDAAYGIDKYFLDRAEDKKRIQSLETAEWQLALFSDLTADQQEAYLKSTMDNLGDSKTLAGSLQTAWLSGDVKQLEAISNEMSVKPAELQKKLLDDRNPKMTDAAEQCLRGTERCFMVVGAGHLIGDKGVVQLLKNRGYKLEQVLVTPIQKN